MASSTSQGTADSVAGTVRQSVLDLYQNLDVNQPKPDSQPDCNK